MTGGKKILQNLICLIYTIYKGPMGFGMEAQTFNLKTQKQISQYNS